MPLNDMKCRVSKPKMKPYKLSDFEGLYLEVMPSGNKLWRLKYRLHGKEKRDTFGSYPLVSLSEAREKKIETKRLLMQGIDPVLMRLQKKHSDLLAQSATFEVMGREWFLKKQGGWSARYAATMLYRMEKYLIPELGAFPMTELKPPVILCCIQKIEETAPEMARRMLKIVNEVFGYTIAIGKCENDYSATIASALMTYKKGHFASIDIDELPNLIRSINNYKCRAYPQTYLAIKLLLLTFVRTSELLEARWDEIDFENKMWIIPAHRMKMRRAHMVPLSQQSVTALQELKALTGHRDFLFPSIPRPQQTMSKGTILVALKRMGYNKKMTGHGFRALAMGVIKEKLRIKHEVIDRQLAHVRSTGNGRSYDRSELLEDRIVMMEHYAQYLDNV